MRRGTIVRALPESSVTLHCHAIYAHEIARAYAPPTLASASAKAAAPQQPRAPSAATGSGGAVELGTLSYATAVVVAMPPVPCALRAETAAAAAAVGASDRDSDVGGVSLAAGTGANAAVLAELFRPLDALFIESSSAVASARANAAGSKAASTALTAARAALSPLRVHVSFPALTEAPVPATLRHALVTLPQWASCSLLLPVPTSASSVASASVLASAAAKQSAMSGGLRHVFMASPQPLLTDALTSTGPALLAGLVAGSSAAPGTAAVGGHAATVSSVLALPGAATHAQAGAGAGSGVAAVAGAGVAAGRLPSVAVTASASLIHTLIAPTVISRVLAAVPVIVAAIAPLAQPPADATVSVETVTETVVAQSGEPLRVGQIELMGWSVALGFAQGIDNEVDITTDDDSGANSSAPTVEADKQNSSSSLSGAAATSSAAASVSVSVTAATANNSGVRNEDLGLGLGTGLALSDVLDLAPSNPLVQLLLRLLSQWGALVVVAGPHRATPALATAATAAAARAADAATRVATGALAAAADAAGDADAEAEAEAAAAAAVVAAAAEAGAAAAGGHGGHGTTHAGSVVSGAAAAGANASASVRRAGGVVYVVPAGDSAGAVAALVGPLVEQLKHTVLAQAVGAGASASAEGAAAVVGAGLQAVWVGIARTFTS